MDPQALLDTLHRWSIWREATLWLSSGRAIHAWRLRKLFRRAGWPVPEEIETYLDSCTEALCDAELTSPDQVAKALKLDGKGRNARVSSDRLAAVQHVLALKSINPERPITQIFNDVAEHLNDKRDDPDKDARAFVASAYYEWRKNI
jgi:hypothetical protein